MGSRGRKLTVALILLIAVAVLLLSGRKERDPAKENLEKAVEVYCLGPDQEIVERWRLAEQEYMGLVPEGTTTAYPSLEEIAKKRFLPYMTEEAFNKSMSARIDYEGIQMRLAEMGYTTSMKDIQIVESLPSKDRRTYAFYAVVECVRPDQEPLKLELNGRAQSGPDGKLTYFLAYVTLEWLIDQAEGKFPLWPG